MEPFPLEEAWERTREQESQAYRYTTGYRTLALTERNLEAMLQERDPEKEQNPAR